MLDFGLGFYVQMFWEHLRTRRWTHLSLRIEELGV